MLHTNVSTDGMPIDLLFVRHGQSESNVLVERRKNGKQITDDFATVPDNSWRLTAKGAKQAEVTGDYIRDNFPDGFNHHFLSPFVRTRETAARLNLSGAEWEENRMLRERSWGEIDGLSIQEFENIYPHNSMLKEKDPIYWVPPAGESLASVAENRSSNFLRSLEVSASGDTVLAVTHGEFIKTVRMILEQWSDETFYLMEVDPSEMIHNCEVIHYSRRDPSTGLISNRIKWIKRSYPAENSYGFVEIVEGSWRELRGKRKLSNDELLSVALAQEKRLVDVELIRAERSHRDLTPEELTCDAV